jgi:RND family efflux transporter MFP subunit
VTARSTLRRPAALAAAFGAYLLLISMLGATLLALEAGATPPEPASNALVVESLRVESLSGYAVAERYTGRVVSRRSSELGFPRAGQLVEVLVEEGDSVALGQPLARLDTARLEAARIELEAQMREIAARLELARLTLKRTSTLADKDSVSKQRHDEARFEEQALAARMASARGALDRVDVDLADSTLEAPYPGSVVARNFDEGTILGVGQAVVKLIESGAMELRVGVSPATAGQLERGRAYPVEVEGRALSAELVAVLDDIAPDTRTVTAILRFAEAPQGVRHGALARLIVESRHEAAGFWLPITALSEGRRGLWSVYALMPDEGGTDLFRVSRRELQLIHAESDRAYVRGTLRDGERVVSTGVQRLVPNQLVRVGADVAQR